MIRKFTVLGLLALSGCSLAIPDFRPQTVSAPTPPPVQTVNPLSAKERFVLEAAANGCVVDANTSDAIMTGAILSSDDMGQIIQQLIVEGRGEIASDQQSFRVTTGACAA